MNVHASLLGPHQLGEEWLSRFGMGRKYPLMLALSLPASIIQAQPVTPTALALTITLLTSPGVDPVRMLRIGRAIWLILGLLAVYQLAVPNSWAAAVVPENLPLVVLVVCLPTLTTSTPELLNTLIVILRPIRFVRLNPERVASAVALMIRFIPYLLDLFDDARDAARARRVERSVVALLMPMMLGSVAHAERMDEILAVRGLGKREQ